MTVRAFSAAAASRQPVCACAATDESPAGRPGHRPLRPAAAAAAAGDESVRPVDTTAAAQPVWREHVPGAATGRRGLRVADPGYPGLDAVPGGRHGDRERTVLADCPAELCERCVESAAAVQLGLPEQWRPVMLELGWKLLDDQGHI